jgi:hypothetical protein
MKKQIIIASAVLVSLIATSCSMVSPGVATQASSVKVGTAEKKVWLGLAFNVDVSIATAAKNGGIKKVATVDYGIRKGFLNTTYITKVTGE